MYYVKNPTFKRIRGQYPRTVVGGSYVYIEKVRIGTCIPALNVGMRYVLCKKRKKNS